MNNKISRRALGLGIAGGVSLFLSGYASAQKMMPESSPVELTPLKSRLSERQIGRDLDKLVQLHLRIDRLNTAGNQQAVYTQAQAYTWLEAARIEYLDNNETGWESFAYGKAKALVEGAERQQYPQMQTAAPINRYFANATQKWNSHKEYLSNNAATLGRQSVLLEWAAYEEQNDPNFVNTCIGYKFEEINKAQYLIPPPVVKAVPVAVLPPVIKTYEFPDSVHFALDEYYLAPQTKEILDKVVRIMKEVPALKINAIGHTDPRAGKVYNDRLSQARVKNVRNYLIAQGVAEDRIRMVFKGEVQMLAKDLDATGHARNRRTELSPQSEVVINGVNIKITNQEADLQLEKPGESREDNDKRRGIAPVKN
jgi:outer membrane protein OmpA-like peptidoglycan-associated protein